MGGPWDGEVLELGDNTTRLYVSTVNATDGESPGGRTRLCDGEYRLSLVDYRMHWIEPAR